LMAAGCEVREVHHVGVVLGVVSTRLGGQSGSLPVTSLPQLDRALASSPDGRHFMLLTEKEVVGAGQWLASEALRRRPLDGDPGMEERRGVMLPGTKPVWAASSSRS
jgi:hypothetical protein